MKLNDFEVVKEKYNNIANRIACKCINSNSFYKAMSAFRNYVSFINIVGAEYFDTIPKDMVAMSKHIEELAQIELLESVSIQTHFIRQCQLLETMYHLLTL